MSPKLDNEVKKLLRALSLQTDTRMMEKIILENENFFYHLIKRNNKDIEMKLLENEIIVITLGKALQKVVEQKNEN